MTTTATTNTLPLLITCHCHLFTLPLLLPLTSFPLKSSLCHCTSCRHATGQLFTTYAVIPGPFPSSHLLTKLAKYSSSKTLDRWFCGVCGASVLNVDRGGGNGNGMGKGKGEWEVGTGCLEVPEGRLGGRGRGLLKRGVLWVGDTGDGGVSGWVGGGKKGSVEGWGGGKWMFGRGGEVASEERVAKMVEGVQKELLGREKGEEVLSGRCHCGAVRIEVLPPEKGAEKKDCSADLCACTSCRRTSGFEVTAWAHVRKDKVRMKGGEGYEVGMKKMGCYESSKGTRRYFCRNCGAKVFYDRDELKRLDIALGLFEAEEGCRAERWFAWDPDEEGVSYMEDAVDQEFVKRLADGVRAMTKGEEKDLK